ncbi:MAG: helix-turn-helix domain-containing protein [Burkholderiales bacterium]|nr:helix-turn-helix domain-containing protein [Burkholderiales bacterium]
MAGIGLPFGLSFVWRRDVRHENDATGGAGECAGCAGLSSESGFAIRTHEKSGDCAVNPRADAALQGGPPPAPSDSYVQSFARGLAVIRAFAADAPSQTLSEVAARTGLDRAGARRILLTLQALGYVAQDGRQFRLTARILDLGYAYLSTTPLWNLAEPIMEELSRAVHESCSASVLEGTEIVYIQRVPTAKIMAISLAIGSRLPAWCSAMGRVLLSALPPEELARVLARSDLHPRTRHTETSPARLTKIIAGVRADGFALVDQELEDGLRSIAVPLVDRGGRVIAAMNLSANAHQVSSAQMVRRLLPPLKDAAARINRALAMRA